MNPVKPLLLAGLASAAIAGFAGLAHAGTPGFKTMTVQLPGGGIEQIEYTGNVAPQVVLMPAAPGGLETMAAPVDFPFGPSDPFAALERISAEMDQQTAAMMQAMDAMTAGVLAQPGALVPAAFTQLPPGGAGYSVVSSVTGSSRGACVQSLQITAMGNGQAPQVVSRSSGDCRGVPGLSAPGTAGPGGAVPAAVLPSAPAPAHQPQLIRVRDLMPQTPSHPDRS